MTRFFISRLLSGLGMLFVLLVVSFLLIRFAPGGPFDGDRAWPAEVRHNLEIRYGLADPFPTQLAKYLGQLVEGDFGTSLHFVDTRVIDLLLPGLKASSMIGLAAFGWSLVFGLLLALGLTLGRNGATGTLSYFLSMTALSLPNYLVASLLILSLAIGLGLFPVALWDSPDSWVLPSLALSFKPAAMIARLLSEAMTTTQKRLFVLAARSRGLKPSAVWFRHILFPSLVGTVTLLGPLVANFVTGSFVIETLFQIPGLGRHFVGSVLNRDYPFVSALTLTFGVILLVSNLLTDLAIGFLDRTPREL